MAPTVDRLRNTAYCPRVQKASFMAREHDTALDEAGDGVVGGEPVLGPCGGGGEEFGELGESRALMLKVRHEFGTSWRCECVL